MAIVADLERLLERLFERTSSRVFRSHIQAVQIEHRVERAMERARVSERGRVAVPHRYRVRLSPQDLSGTAAAAGGADALAGRLADAALRFARAHAYHLHDRPTVALVADPAIPRGEIAVEAVASAGSTTAISPASPGEPARPQAADARGGIRSGESDTMVFRRPAPVVPRAVLRAVAPDGSERTIEITGTPVTVGRAPDNGIVLTDTRVSRHHGRFQSRHGALLYADLGSTNGSRVNGVRVDEIALGAGDRLELGDTVLVVELVPG